MCLELKTKKERHGSVNLYSVIEKLQKLFGDLVDNQKEPQSEKDGVVLFAMVKSDKTLNAILLLCKKGFGEDATILSRSLFEIYWNLEYILSVKNNSLAKRFWEYDWVVRKEMYDYIKNEPQFQQYLLDGESGNIIREVNDKSDEMQAKYDFKRPFGWSPVSIRKMAEDLGHDSIYKTAYKIQCSLSHFSPRAANEYFKENGDGTLFLDAGPSENLVDVSLYSSGLIYLTILKIFNNHFSKDFDQQLNEVEEEIKSIKR